MSKKKIYAFIPIKEVSRRIPRKNFRSFAGNPLFHYILSAAVKADRFDKIFVHTDSKEVVEYAATLGIEDCEAPAEMVGDYVNGNMTMRFWGEKFPEAAYIFELYATAPLLASESIAASVDGLLSQSDKYDSVFTATEELGWFWFLGYPVNFRPSVLPRSQDADKVVKETTGLYGISSEALARGQERIGAKPYVHLVPTEESLDIDTPEDWRYAEEAARKLGVQDRLIDIKEKVLVGS